MKNGPYHLGDYSDDDPNVDAAANGNKPRPKGKIPYPPGRDASFSELRQWLSNAAGLPAEVRVEAITRTGRDPEDAAILTLSNGMTMRCPHQGRLQLARTLQAWLASESDGIAHPAYLSPPEVGDFYTVVCRLASASAREDPAGDLHERLAAFAGMCEHVRLSLGRRARYDTIQRLKKRGSFDRRVAMDMRMGRPDIPPVLLVDVPEGRRYVRATEWVAYLRFVLGETVDESRLPAQMAELESERIDPQAWNSDRSHKVHMVFYTLPDGLGDGLGGGEDEQF